MCELDEILLGNSQEYVGKTWQGGWSRVGTRARNLEDSVNRTLFECTC